MKPFSLVCLLAAAALTPVSAQKANPFTGRWDLVVTPKAANAKVYPDWMEVGLKDGAPAVRIQPRAGSAFYAKEFKVEGTHLSVLWELSISRMSVAAILQMGSDGRIIDARIVPGAAFPTWKRVPEAEEMLIGQKPGAKLFAATGQKVSEEMIKVTGRRWSTEYKEPVIAVLVRRALEHCASKVGQCVSPAQPAEKASRRRQARRPALRFPRADSQSQSAGRNAEGSRECHITTTINGRSHTLTTPANRTLLDLLRDQLGLLGTKCGCEIGECGACTVLLDGEPVNSCLVLAPQIDGREVLTVEGLAQDGKLHPLQESFLDQDAVD